MSKSLAKWKVTKLTKTVTFLKPMSCILEKKSKKPNSVLSLKIQKQKNQKSLTSNRRMHFTKEAKDPYKENYVCKLWRTVKDGKSSHVPVPLK